MMDAVENVSLPEGACSVMCPKCHLTLGHKRPSAGPEEDAEARVKTFFPGAYIGGPMKNGSPDPNGSYWVMCFSTQSGPSGSGKTPAAAWADAALKLPSSISTEPQHETNLAALHCSLELLVKALEKSPHLPNCRFRERLCSQPNCSEVHVIPCSCGRDAALDSARDLQPIHAAGPLNP